MNLKVFITLTTLFISIRRYFFILPVIGNISVIGDNVEPFGKYQGFIDTGKVTLAEINSS